MIQVLPPGQTFSSEFGKAIGGLAGGIAGRYASDKYQEMKNAPQNEQKRNFVQQILGIDASKQSPENLQKSYEQALGVVADQAKQENKYGLKQKYAQEAAKQYGFSEDEETRNQNIPKGILKPEEEENWENINPITSKKLQKKEEKRYPDELILKTALYDKSAADVMREHNRRIDEERRHQENLNLKEEEKNLTKFQKDREYHSQFSKPVIESANKIISAAPARKGLMDQWRRDIESGQTSGLGQFLVERTGLEFWRNPESARFKSAAKEYFIEGLQNLAPGTRPNMFIEQQLMGAQPTIGRDKESGLTVLEMQSYLDDLKEKKAELELEMAQEDIDKYGYARQDISQRAAKQLKDYAEERQTQLAYNIRKIHEDQIVDDKDLANEIITKKIPQGTPLTPRTAQILSIKNNYDEKSALQEALRLGFDVPKVKK